MMPPNYFRQDDAGTNPGMPPTNTGETPMSPAEHLLSQTRGRSASLASVLARLEEVAKKVNLKVRRLGLNGLWGGTGETNIHGEHIQKMDRDAHEDFVHALRSCAHVAMVVSEETDEAILFNSHRELEMFDVLLDPLDGSSNLRGCGSVGSIYSIFNTSDRGGPGSKQAAAAYTLYGAQTVFVYTAGAGVHSFVLDPVTNAYSLCESDIIMPKFGGIYSVNQANERSFPQVYRVYLEALQSGIDGRSFTLRYTGALVADFHRTLVNGGIFLYPPTVKHREGKLRLAYEAGPLSMIAEQAGGWATDGERRILDIHPRGVHQRTPLVLGGVEEMLQFERTLAALPK
jgi:fructose-1,6-bisphosphatase I